MTITYSIAVLNPITEELSYNSVSEELAYSFSKLSKGQTGIVCWHCEETGLSGEVNSNYLWWSWMTKIVDVKYYDGEVTLEYMGCELATKDSQGKINYSNFPKELGQKYMDYLENYFLALEG